jgi:hypothetical protein
MTVSKKDFTNRLLKVLGKRRKHSWGSELGFTNNRIHRLFKETEPLPSSEELALIGEAENLNLNWLLYAVGPTHRVSTFSEPEEFNIEVEGCLEDDWSTYQLLVNQARCALLASKQISWEYKDKLVNIRKMVCVIGSGSAKLQSIVSQHTISGIEIPTYRFEELELGELGLYTLLGDGRSTGIFDDLDKKDIHWMLGNMPITGIHHEIDLVCLIDCYNKIQSYKKSTGQLLSDVKMAELTWVMYQTEVNEIVQSNLIQRPSRVPVDDNAG